MTNDETQMSNEDVGADHQVAGVRGGGAKKTPATAGRPAAVATATRTGKLRRGDAEKAGPRAVRIDGHEKVRRSGFDGANTRGHKKGGGRWGLARRGCCGKRAARDELGRVTCAEHGLGPVGAMNRWPLKALPASERAGWRLRRGPADSHIGPAGDERCGAGRRGRIRAGSSRAWACA